MERAAVPRSNRNSIGNGIGNGTGSSSSSRTALLYSPVQLCTFPFGPPRMQKMMMHSQLCSWLPLSLFFLGAGDWCRKGRERKERVSE